MNKTRQLSLKTILFSLLFVAVLFLIFGMRVQHDSHLITGVHLLLNLP